MGRYYVGIKITDFALRHFNSANSEVGTKINCLPEVFEAKVNEFEFSPKEGYAPFCKHFFVPNFVSATAPVLEITPENRNFLNSGYIARTPNELPVLTRWFDQNALGALAPQAKFLDLILYSREQLEKEDGKPFPADWGIVAILGVLDEEEQPMLPMTMLRNALGIEYGGSGAPLDKVAYLKAVEFWQTHAILK